MKMTGHKTEAVYRRYAIVDEAMLIESGAKLQALHTSQASGQQTATSWETSSRCDVTESRASGAQVRQSPPETGAPGPGDHRTADGGAPAGDSVESGPTYVFGRG
jgi:hypothetical protein